ncbi:hypothetical protein LSCM1_05791 [Leishmania martiniquensis]|uniref:Uncharacterized protein n=1 Tax=Leishmania martiniquensis TaxID=1580590 RepID=A0A836H9J6_9TRYP|nr:hypothetical protein LSCM1_05791 [Leishmania martiniquensis]
MLAGCDPLGCCTKLRRTPSPYLFVSLSQFSLTLSLTTSSGRMGACCSNSKHSNAGSHSEAAGHATVKDGFKSVQSSALRFQPIAFDVVVSDAANTATNTPQRGSGAAENAMKNFSGTLSDASLHTLRDLSLAVDRSACSYDPMSETLNNMSFTNSFHAVDKNAVRQFMRTVARLAERSNSKGTLLEESMMSASLGTEASVGGRSMLGGFNASILLQEDLDYIAAGATLQDRVARLEEVEAVLRRSIDGSWRMDLMLLQLAYCQIVPTLRQRRRPWAAGKGNTKHNKNAAQQRSKRQPVLVIHARGLQMDASVSMAAPSLSASRASPTGRSELSGPNSSEGKESGYVNNSLVLGTSRSRASESPGGTKVQQYELLALTCSDIDPKRADNALVVTETWDFLSVNGAAATLNEGRCIFRFMCGSLAEADPETRSIVDAIINLSSFADEETENNVPKVNVYDNQDAAKYIGIHVKAMYMLPGIALKDLTKNLVVSAEYQKSCQPSENKIQDCETVDTFRLTMTIIRFVFSLTIQFKVSEITDQAVLKSLAVCDGMVPAKAIMLERTKRNIAKVDATAKVRSMLLYYPVNDGVLVNNHTVVLNTSLPKVVSKIMNSFGSQGASQSVQTAKLTREYLLKRFGDSRRW